jgi:autotransporter-associated beta strand protein
MNACFSRVISTTQFQDRSMKARRVFSAASVLMIASFVSLVSVAELKSASLYWTTSGTTGTTWNTTTNWSTVSNATTPHPGAVPGIGDDVYFNVTTINGAETLTLDADQAANSLNFSNTGSTTIQNNAASNTTAHMLTIGAGGIIINSGAGAVTITSAGATFGVTNITVGAQESWTNNSSSTFLINGFPATPKTAVTVSNPLTINGNGNTTINNGAKIVGDGGITKSGIGTLTIGNVGLSSSRWTIGTGGGGDFNMSAGSLFVNASQNIDLGGSTAISANYTQTGGTATFAPTNTAGNGLYINNTTGAAMVATFSTSSAFTQIGSATAVFVGNGTAAGSVGNLNIGSGTSTAIFTAPTIYIGAKAGNTGNVTIGSNGVLDALSLTSTNTATGNLYIDGGTLQVDIATTNNSTFLGNVLSTAQITNNGATINTNGINVTVAQGFADYPSNSGSLTKIGAGKLTLSGTNTYSGNTSVTAGTLALASSLGGGLSTAGATTLIVSGSPAVAGAAAISGSVSLADGVHNNTLIVNGGMTTNATAYNFNIGNVANQVLVNGGALTVGGVTTINVTPTNGFFGVGPYTLFFASNGNVNGFGNLQLSTTAYGLDTAVLQQSGGSVNLALTGPLTTSNIYWTGSQSATWGGNSPSGSSYITNWATDASGGTVANIPLSTSNVFFSASGGGTNLTTTLGQDLTINSLTFTADADAGHQVAISGTNLLTIGGSGGITVNPGSGAHTISSSGVVLGVAQTWTNGSANPFTVSAPISGSNLTIAAGTSPFILTGSNTYGSTTIATGGSLQIGSGGTTGTFGTGSVADAGAIIFNRADTVAPGLLITNIFSGTGSVVVSGGGIVTIGAGPQSYNGVATVSSNGTLQIGTGGSVINFAKGINLLAGGTLINSTSSSSGSVSPSVSGAGTWILQGAGGSGQGGMLLTGNNSAFTGTVYVNNGTQIQFNTTQSTQPTGGTIVVQNGGGALVNVLGTVLNTPLVLSGIGWSQSTGTLGALQLGGSNTAAANITLAGNASVSAYRAFGYITGVINGNGNQLELRTGNIPSTDTLVLAPTAANALTSLRVNSSMAVTTSGSLTLLASNSFAFAGSPSLSLAGASVSGTNCLAIVKLNGQSFTFANLSSDNAYAQIQNGSAGTASTITIGSDNTNTTYSGALINGGVATLALAKTGNGMLTLAGTSSYTGGTTIGGGTLALGPAGTLGTPNLTINPGGVFDVSAYNPAGYAFSSGTLSAGRTAGFATDIKGNLNANNSTLNFTGGTVAAGTITVSGSLGLSNSATLNYLEGDQIKVSGALTLTGTDFIAPLTPLGTGTYTLFTYGSLIGSTSNLAFSGQYGHAVGRQTLTLNTSGGTAITLTVLGNNANLLWTGAAGNTWDNGTTQSWTNSGTADVFYGGDSVTFDDSAGTTHAAVNITGGSSGSVQPGTLTVSNTNVNYIFSGSPIAGGGALIMNGPGALTINNSNAYSGGTQFNGGLLNLGTSAALGTGVLTINGGSLDNSSSASMTLAGNIAQTWSGDFTFKGTQSLNLGTGAVTLGGNRTVTVNANTLTVGGAIGDGGNTYSLTVPGPGTLALAGSNSYGGGTILQGGILAINNNSALGSGTLTISGGSIDSTVAGVALANNRQIWNADINFLGTQNLSMGTGAVAMTVPLNINVSASTLTIGGAISDGGNFNSLTVNGPGTLDLSGNNSFGGGLTINSGRVRGDTATAFGAAAATVLVNSGGQAWLNNTTTNTLLTVANNFQIAGNGNDGLGALRVSGSAGWAINGNIVLTDSARITANAGAQGISPGDFVILYGAISGPSTAVLEKTGSGAIAISGNISPPVNTFSGTYLISAGTLNLLRAGNDAAIQGPLTVAAGAYVVYNPGFVNQISNGVTETVNGVLDFNSGSDTIGQFSGSGTIRNLSTSGSIGFQFNTSYGSSSTFNGTFINNSTAGNGVHMRTFGALNGEVTQEFTNSFSQTGSIIAFGSNDGFYPLRLLFSGTASAAIKGATLGDSFLYSNAALEVRDNATLTLGSSGLGSVNSNNTFTLGGGSGQARLILSASWATPYIGETVLVNGTSGSPIINTGIYSAELLGTVSGSGGLIKTGSGTLVLSGNNTYDGGTTVNAGTLIATNSQAIADGTNLYIGNPALLLMLPAPVIPAAVVSAPNGIDAAPASVPEPGTLVLFAAILGGATVYRRMRRHDSSLRAT